MSIAIDSKQRAIELRRLRNQLDPEAAKLDEEYHSLDASHAPDTFMRQSTKDIWLVSLDPAAKQKIFCQHPYYAAIRLQEKTHRLAETQEIDAYLKLQAERREQAKVEEEKKALPGVAALASAITGLADARGRKQA